MLKLPSSSFVIAFGIVCAGAAVSCGQSAGNVSSGMMSSVSDSTNIPDGDGSNNLTGNMNASSWAVRSVIYAFNSNNMATDAGVSIMMSTQAGLCERVYGENFLDNEMVFDIWIDMPLGVSDAAAAGAYNFSSDSGYNASDANNLAAVFLPGGPVSPAADNGASSSSDPNWQTINLLAFNGQVNIAGVSNDGNQFLNASINMQRLDAYSPGQISGTISAAPCVGLGTGDTN